MVKNKQGGNKAKKLANKEDALRKRPLRVKNKDIKDEDNNIEYPSDELYGIVECRTGGKPPGLVVKTEDKVIRESIICGRLSKGKNRSWCNKGDIVIVDIDLSKEGRKDKPSGRVVHKYEHHEHKKLEKLGEIDRSNFFKDEINIDNLIDYSEEINENKNEERKNNSKKDYYTDIILPSSSSDDEIDLNNI